ncbi:12517_t:CDS:2, partial [Dentiscutata erythropus]
MNIQDNPTLTVDDFFKLSFGLTPIKLDPTEFVTNELTEKLFASLIKSSLKEQSPTGIFRNLFLYLVDIISRKIPITRLVNYIQKINKNNEFDDVYKILQRFEEFCTSRDFLIAFLDKVSKNSFSKILNTLVAANIPISIYLSNDTHSQKGIKVLNGMRISNLNSIDISFYAVSENHSYLPLAILEVYYDELGSSTLSDTASMSFSKILADNTKNLLLENDFVLSIAKLKLTCHANIFYASHCENKIKKLRDKTCLKTPEDSKNYKTE